MAAGRSAHREVTHVSVPKDVAEKIAFRNAERLFASN